MRRHALRPGFTRTELLILTLLATTVVLVILPCLLYGPFRGWRNPDKTKVMNQRPSPNSKTSTAASPLRRLGSYFLKTATTAETTKIPIHTCPNLSSLDSSTEKSIFSPKESVEPNWETTTPTRPMRYSEQERTYLATLCSPTEAPSPPETLRPIHQSSLSLSSTEELSPPLIHLLTTRKCSTSSLMDL